MKVKNKSPWGHFKHSENEETHKESLHFDIEKNAIKVISDDTLMFSKPVTIMDNTELWSGAKYDIPTLDISEYKGKLTADHRDLIQNVLGTVIGVRKVANRRVTIDGIKLAVKENPLADYAKRMVMAGYLTDFSIETIGPWPDDDGIFKNAKMVGLSLVVTGNNKQAHINEIAEQTLADAKLRGLDTAVFAQALKLPIDKENSINDNIDMFKTVKNTRGFAVTVKFKNSAGEEIEVTLQPGKSVDVPSDEAKAVKNTIDNATEPKAPETPAKPAQPATPAQPAAGEGEGDKGKDVSTIVKNAIEEATKPLTDKIATLESAFDNGVKEPQFTKVNSPKVVTELGGMDYRDRHGAQINHAWDWLKAGNSIAGQKLNEINKFHLDLLKEKDLVRNSVTIGDFGNFVISPELLTDIEGFRSNFQPLISKVNFRDTLSLQMAWLVRNGDVNMQEVEMCDDGEDGNLKPISEYSANIKTSNLHELAAVTPVCNAATRFLAADLLGDIAQGYRTDFDRKKAQLFIARLEQAIITSGKTVHYNTGTAGLGANVNSMQSFFSVGATMQEDVMNGVYILSQASYWEMMGRQMSAGINTDSGFKIFTTGENGSLMLGAPYIIVPNELLPKLGSNQTKTFVVEGVSVVITHAVFYVDLSTFSGRTSGGLNYDLSTEAAYEESGVVKSAFQRNELVLRGSFFRGGAVRDVNKVVGLKALNLS